MPKILAIDDKQDNLITISALLKNLIPDCTVITSDSGAEGIKKAEAEQPDAILLDIKMPEMDGYEVCRHLKSNEKTKHIPIVMLTAIKTDPQSRTKGLNLGADAFLSKPVNESELVAQIKVMLRIKKAEDLLRKEKALLEDTVREKTKVLEERTHDLVERVKEMKCLYGISNLVENPGISLGEIMQGTVDLIPSSWQYPEITCAQILLEDERYKTENFKETNWKQSSDILVHGKYMGVLKVCFLEERPEIDEGPFLKEERDLINAMTERIGHIIEKKLTEQALQGSEEKYKSLVESTEDFIYLVDRDGTYLFVNKKHLTRLGSQADKITGKTYGDFHPLEDTKELMREIEEVFETGQTGQHEHRSHRDNRYFLRTLSPVKSLDGHTTSVTVVSKDITEWVRLVDRQDYRPI